MGATAEYGIAEQPGLVRQSRPQLAAGLLDISDATVAARQLGALTVLLAYDDQPNPGHVDLGRVESTTTAGVRTFMRAFSTSA